jgi:trimeric autotransporter adhesin
MFARMLFSALAALALPTTSLAQCGEWDARFSSYVPGIAGPVSAEIVFDDGSGPALYVAGDFTTAGNVLAKNIARWDGTDWSPLGAVQASNDKIRTLAVFDDGSGPALYAGGDFTTIGGVLARRAAKWNGSSWSALGTATSGPNNPVISFAVFDDGAGPALFAGGSFTSVSGMDANHVAKWNGAHWSTLGESGGGTNSDVWTLATFDDGTGPALYVGGSFVFAGGIPASRIARWDGAAWSALGAGVGSAVQSLLAFDDGSGPALFVGGAFTTAGGNPASRVAKWDGLAWSPLGAGVGGIPSEVSALLAFDDGSGPALFAGGVFAIAGGGAASRIAKWDGTSWSPLGAGVAGVGAAVRALAVFDAGSGPELFAGGNFTSAGGTTLTDFARWNGASWSPIGPTGQGVDSDVFTLAVFDDGSGPALHVGGFFAHTGSTVAHDVAKWDGAQWSSVGSPLTGFNNTVRALSVFDEGSGPRLFAGGDFTAAGGLPATRIARWDGTAWSELGPSGVGISGTVHALASFDDGSGSALYAAGSFASAGGVSASCIARWNGTTWSQVGGGLNLRVWTLTVFDDGSGPALYAGGEFTTAGGNFAHHVAKWDGSAWSAIGPAGGIIDGTVSVLTVHDDGSGPALFAGGEFVTVAGTPANRIAKWNGTSWSALGSGTDAAVYALTSFDDGSGTKLHAGGNFVTAGGNPAKRIASWNGTSWSALGGPGSGFDARVQALAVFDDGADGDADLYAGGMFLTAGSVPSERFAQWHGCPATPSAFCFGDGSLVACPCANDGLAGHGCENSASTGGALLAASGTTTGDTLVLTQADMLPTALSIFAQGSAELGSPVVFGDGLRCVGGALKRLYAKSAVLGTASAPEPGDSSISARSAELGDPLFPGDVRYYYVYYRDSSPSFCASPAGNTFNVGNALRVTW